MTKIVIIEDEKEVRDILLETFSERSQFKVKAAGNGKDGFELVKSMRPDVILLDIKLTVQMDGVEVLRRIRGAGTPVKVIVITGYADAAVEKRVREIGVEAFIEKPFEPPEIIQAVEKVLKQRG